MRSILLLIYLLVLPLHTPYSFIWYIMILLESLVEILHLGLLQSTLDIILGILLICVLVIYLKGNKRIQGNIDYVLVLGYALEENKIQPILQDRLDKAKEYLVTHPECKVVVSGGITKGNKVSEASMMEDYLIKHGISKKRIIKEDHSTTTIENLAYSKSYLPTNASILLVTSHFHMYRASIITKKAGYTNLSYLPAASRWSELHFGLLEVYFLLELFMHKGK